MATSARNNSCGPAITSVFSVRECGRDTLTLFPHVHTCQTLNVFRGPFGAVWHSIERKRVRRGADRKAYPVWSMTLTSVSKSRAADKSDIPDSPTALETPEAIREFLLAVKPGDVFNPYGLFKGVFLPFAVLQHPKLQPNAKVLYAVLSWYAGKDGRCYPSQGTLARDLGLESDKQVRNLLNALINEGFVK